MKFVMFDTETTDMVLWQSPSDDPNQPDIIQLAAYLYDSKSYSKDGQFEPIDGFDYIIHTTKPVNASAAKVHGITPEKIAESGVHPELGMTALLNLIDKAGCLVAFNASFDMHMLRIMYKRYLQHMDVSLIDTRPKYCAMLTAQRAMSVRKWPKLHEAYRALIHPDGFDNAHDAQADTKAAAAVFARCLLQGHGPVELTGHYVGNRKRLL